ncbi:LysR family transcriptional regulator [Bradyrhizobium jicamae]|uniref:LysR family transcriptional regulator n=1 Tax=Bradyrhizobium jicamae TaxID=280332 RepID=A0ABS5FW87_9BRAD|nr:LysR family transcriptional regulator [Bradyrhizobium jicamae]MBR0801074.1 LysR family transcriptional regulator [Bradyrhizobium jicamae]
MDLYQLRCFVVAAEELHFGRAARRLEILPSVFGRNVRLLEEDLGTKLFLRTTRSVALSADGEQLLRDARKLITLADGIHARFREGVRSKAAKLRVGAIDSAAAGLLPLLLNDFRKEQPEVAVQLFEDKTIRLLPRVLSGRLDLAFVRPPKGRDPNLVYRHLLYETPVVAMTSKHPLARRTTVGVKDIANQPLIVPDRRSRPHSHDLTIKLFEKSGYEPRVAQVADEKQTIVNLVSTGLGIAIVPRWTSRMAIKGVAFLPLQIEESTNASRLPLAAVWMRNSRDALRDSLLETLSRNIQSYAAQA